MLCIDFSPSKMSKMSDSLEALTADQSEVDAAEDRICSLGTYSEQIELEVLSATDTKAEYAFLVTSSTFSKTTLLLQAFGNKVDKVFDLKMDHQLQVACNEVGCNSKIKTSCKA